MTAPAQVWDYQNGFTDHAARQKTSNNLDWAAVGSTKRCCAGDSTKECATDDDCTGGLTATGSEGFGCLTSGWLLPTDTNPKFKHLRCRTCIYDGQDGPCREQPASSEPRSNTEPEELKPSCTMLPASSEDVSDVDPHTTTQGGDKEVKTKCTLIAGEKKCKKEGGNGSCRYNEPAEPAAGGENAV